MDPVADTPTEPIDYAALTATYGTLLGTVLLAARGAGEEPVRAGDLPPLGLAAFALTKLVAKEKAESWVRSPFVDESGDDRHPKGRRLRFALGELMTCTRCLGAWSSLGLVALRVSRPREARIVTAVLATSALNDWLHSGFSWLCAEADVTGERGEIVARRAREGRFTH